MNIQDTHFDPLTTKNCIDFNCANCWNVVLMSHDINIMSHQIT